MIDNAVSLFAGIGGFDLAMARCGLDVAATVEIDRTCRETMSRNVGALSPAMQYGDIQGVTGESLRKEAGFWPETGLITAGWPCQGNSVAGGRKGLADTRSSLWWEIARLLDETRPKWFLGENVAGLLSVNGGGDFGEIIGTLESIGYGLAWRVLDAQFFGVPQRRRRVFIAGCLGDGIGPAEVLLEPEGGGGDSPPGQQAGAPIAGAIAGSADGGGGAGVTVVSTLQGGGKRGYRVDAEGAAGNQLVPMVAHTLTSGVSNSKANPPGRRAEDDYNLVIPLLEVGARTGKSTDDRRAGIGIGENGDPMYTLQAGKQHGVGTAVGVRRLTPVECERLQGFPDGWTAGQSDSARYRQLGNAVAVPVVEWIVRRMVSNDPRAILDRGVN